MGLNNLVGGRGFTLGKFTNNFNSSATSGNLKKFKDPILKVVKEKASAIQGGRFKSTEVLNRLERQEKLGYEAKRDISRVLKRLETTPVKDTEKVSRREVIVRALKAGKGEVKTVAKDRPEKQEIKVRINREDSEFNQEKIKDNRVSAAQNRLSGATGVAGSGPTPPKAATPEALPASNNHERISLN